MGQAIDIPTKPVAAIRQPKLRALYDYWDRIRGDRTMPARADFDPLDIPDLLKDLILVDVEDKVDGLRFRYRLAGTAVEEYLGVSLTGKYIDEVMSPVALVPFRETYIAPVTLKRPVYSSTGLRLPNMDYPRVISRLILPLSSDGVRVNILLNGQSFDRRSGEPVPIAEVSDYELLDVFAIDG